MGDFPQEELQVYRNRSMGGGINTRSSPLDIRDDQGTELQNVDISTPGQRIKRTGYSLVATGITQGPILALSEFKPRGNVATEILAVAPGSSWNELWKWDGTSTVFTFVAALVGHDRLMREHITIAQDLVGSHNHVKEAILNPEGERFRYNYGYTGSAGGGYVSDLATCYFGTSTLPNGFALEFAFSQAWGSGDADNEGKVFFSDIASCTSTGFGDPGNQAIHSITLGGGRRQNVVAIRGFRNQEVVIFLSDRIEEIIVEEDENTAITDITAAITTRLWARKIIDDTIGCCSQRSVVKVADDIFFCDQYANVRSLKRTALDAAQGTTSLPISDPIQSYIDRINRPYAGRIAATHWQRWYVISFPLDSATTPSHTFRYDTTLNAWEGPYPGVAANAWTVATLDQSGVADALHQPQLYFGDAVQPFVYRMFTGQSDNGSAIAYRETTKRIDYGQLDLMKQWIRLELIAEGTAAINLTIEADTGQGFVTIGTVDLTGDAPVLPHGFPLMLGGAGVVFGKLSLESLPRSRYIQLRFSASSATDTIKILGFNLYAYVQNFEWDVVTPATQVA